jgi:hypothetical protein
MNQAEKDFAMAQQNFMRKLTEYLQKEPHQLKTTDAFDVSRMMTVDVAKKVQNTNLEALNCFVAEKQLI